MVELQLPDEAAEFIAYQRTDALRFTKSRVYRTLKPLLPSLVYKSGVALEAKFRSESIKDFYREDIYAEFETLREHIPLSTRSILDIGCGIAGVDVHIARHLDNNCRIYLLDKSRTDDTIFYGFKHQGAFYNSLELAKTVLIDNGVTPTRVQLIEARDDNVIDLEPPIDCVISLISWGFHYPVATYLDAVHNLLSENGCLILDVRKNSPGLEQLKIRFASTQTIYAEAKFERVLARKAA